MVWRRSWCGGRLGGPPSNEGSSDSSALQCWVLESNSNETPSNETSEHPKVPIEQLLGCLLEQAPLVLAERVKQPFLHCSHPLVSLRQNFGSEQATDFVLAQLGMR